MTNNGCKVGNVVSVKPLGEMNENHVRAINTYLKEQNFRVGDLVYVWPNINPWIVGMLYNDLIPIRFEQVTFLGNGEQSTKYRMDIPILYEDKKELEIYLYLIGATDVSYRMRNFMTKLELYVCQASFPLTAQPRYAIMNFEDTGESPFSRK